MHIRLKDDFIESDVLLGPMPNLNEPFESFFRRKAAVLLGSIEKHLADNDGLDDDCDSMNEATIDTEDQFVSIKDDTNGCFSENQSTSYNGSCYSYNNSFVISEDSQVMEDLNRFKWMYDVELAKNCKQQNLDIIYNDNQVYYKTTRTIFRNEVLYAYPSKDLEISLGLQYFPLLNSDEKYTCRKCLKLFDHQHYLVLHLRYFCPALLKFSDNLSSVYSSSPLPIKRPAEEHEPESNGESAKRTIITKKKAPLLTASKIDRLKLMNEAKRKRPDFGFSEEKESQSNGTFVKNSANIVEQENNLYAKYLQGLFSSYLTQANYNLSETSKVDPRYSISSGFQKAPVPSVLPFVADSSPINFQNPHLIPNPVNNYNSNMSQIFYSSLNNHNWRDHFLNQINLNSHFKQKKFSEFESAQKHANENGYYLANRGPFSSSQAAFTPSHINLNQYLPNNGVESSVIPDTKPIQSFPNIFSTMLMQSLASMNHSGNRAPTNMPTISENNYHQAESKSISCSPPVSPQSASSSPLMTSSVSTVSSRTASTSFSSSNEEKSKKVNSSRQLSAGSVKTNLKDFSSLINSQTLQNWCAKCNTHFRLTSDLVYHMRTFHKREESKFSQGLADKSSQDLSMSMKLSSPTSIESQSYLSSVKESKFLKCEICNEIFKERHHLSRHMTSHRS